MLIIVFVATSLVIGKMAIGLYRRYVPFDEEDTEESLALVYEERSDGRFLTMCVGWILSTPLFWCVYKLIMYLKANLQ